MRITIIVINSINQIFGQYTQTYLRLYIFIRAESFLDQGQVTFGVEK